MKRVSERDRQQLNMFAVEQSVCCPCSGIFVCGEHPLWLFAARGTLVPHPMDVEGAVQGFTPFHNINCARVLPLACVAYALLSQPLCWSPGTGR